MSGGRSARQLFNDPFDEGETGSAQAQAVANELQRLTVIRFDRFPHCNMVPLADNPTRSVDFEYVVFDLAGGNASCGD